MAVYSKVLASSILAAATTIAGVSAVHADTWRYAFEEAMDEVQGKFAQKFKEEVEANSDHEIQLFPYGTLGESADIMEQTQAGILQFVDQSPGFTGALIPEAQVFFVPYLLPQDDQELFEFFRTSKAITEMFPELYAKQGLELLTMFPEGDVAITTREPLKSPADLNEVKVRVMTNPLLVESYKAFGATPTPLPWGEVYGALQTGIIQGQENPTFYILSNKLYEVSDYMTYIGHNNFTTAVMANQDFYSGLSEEDQTMIGNAIDVAFEYILDYQQGQTEEAINGIMEAKPGYTVTTLTEEERQPFKDAAAQVEAAFIEMTGDSGKSLLEQFKADLDAVKK
ncbi:TRAP transporter substrate-binding protein DctP [Oceaniglobus ichthyenteri]|uniref:TRAP transporter substrate-binding protein n=1 Tax=Oceaniglobus ichthyenteri TaxID=2136177 RepID=UPI000D349FA2|nr:TRAP transporter substrate-binding protein DctP [Oceaniglobus ichthyenteri]